MSGKGKKEDLKRLKDTAKQTTSPKLIKYHIVVWKFYVLQKLPNVKKGKKLQKNLLQSILVWKKTDNCGSLCSSNTPTIVECEPQPDDGMDVPYPDRLEQSGEQLLKMIGDVGIIFDNIPASCWKENEVIQGLSWAERTENFDTLWEGVRESLYENFLSKQAYPLTMQCEKCSLSPSGGRVFKCSTCKKHLCCGLSKPTRRKSIQIWKARRQGRCQTEPSWWPISAIAVVRIFPCVKEDAISCVK
ncbi:Uncharacterized protein APZ42_003585, partial [Daphnia magna]